MTPYKKDTHNPTAAVSAAIILSGVFIAGCVFALLHHRAAQDKGA